MHLIYYEEGNPVVLQNGEPLGGTFLTSLWDKNEIAADERVFTTPSSIYPGAYMLLIGIYILETIQTLQVKKQGIRIPKDAMA